MPLVPLHRIGFVGTYPPRRCGIATYTHDLRDAIAATLGDAECLVVPVIDTDAGGHPPEVRFTIHDTSLPAYRRAAEYLNLCNVDVVSLQHEYGIFGGPAGEHILALLDRTTLPVIVTLHTILEKPNADERRVLEGLLRRAARVIVMAERGREILTRVYGADPRAVDGAGEHDAAPAALGERPDQVDAVEPPSGPVAAEVQVEEREPDR